MLEEIPGRLAEVRARVADAAGRSGRTPDAVRLIAVSKTHPIDAVRAAADAGQLDFGENKVQEALQKIQASTDTRLRWHLIGHLQSNKAKKAGESFAFVHSIDSADLLRKVDQAAAAARRAVFGFFQRQVDLHQNVHGAACRSGSLIHLAKIGRAHV